jgi:hypothetical protein
MHPTADECELYMLTLARCGLTVTFAPSVDIEDVASAWKSKHDGVLRRLQRAFKGNVDVAKDMKRMAFDKMTELTKQVVHDVVRTRLLFLCPRLLAGSLTCSNGYLARCLGRSRRSTAPRSRAKCWVAWGLLVALMGQRPPPPSSPQRRSAQPVSRVGRR